MKNNLIAYVMAVLIMPIVFSQCKEHPGGSVGDIPLNPDSARKHIIPIDTAIKMTRSFEAARKELTAIVSKAGDSLTNIIDLPYDESFNRHIFALLLNQEGAAGIRIYLGREEGSNKGKLIMVPIDSAGNNITVKLLYKEKPINVPGISSARAFRRDADAAEKGNHCSPPCPLQ